MKISLPNGCFCSKITVYPANWNTKKASTEINWYISFRFYDPELPVKRFEVKGMNEIKDLAERARHTKDILDRITASLHSGFNPITNKLIAPVTFEYEINPNTPFLQAIDKAVARLKLSKKDAYSMKSCIKYVIKSIRQMRFDDLHIDQVRRRHIKLILEQCEKNQERWSPATFNHYRSYLMMIFNELLELDTVDINPVISIKKLPVPKKLRPTLTDLERSRIDAYLNWYFPNYRRWVHIFFHSSARITELGKVKADDVDVDNQRFKIWILKRGQPVQVWKPIKTIALPFWQDALKDCRPDQYIFSHGFKPGTALPLPQYFTDFWRDNIKQDLKIESTLYLLKHLNLDETAKLLSLKRAKDAAGHLSENTTLIYAQGQHSRDDEDLKTVNNPFV